jgi:hypothetical protein
MTHFKRFLLVFIGALANIAGSAYAQQPPDPVATDFYGNTASGTNALLHLEPGTDPLPFGQGLSNSAFGGGALQSNTTGSYNTAIGGAALLDSTTANGNTAVGMMALHSNTTGSLNTAVGASSLLTNSTGYNNIAVGYQALYWNKTGANNSAVGFQALYANQAGTNNNASGLYALYHNTNGSQNNAVGVEALDNNDANDNNAMGFTALYENTTGFRNNAVGSQAMYNNTVGYANNAQGYETLYQNTSGNFNNAVGYLALFNNTTGSYNVAIGQYAGYYQTSGSNDIYIANQGLPAESGVIRIGAPSTQSKAFLAGISGTTITGAAVYVTSSGQLGVLASSERYKTAIQPISVTSDKLQQLRPVSFHLKSEPTGAVQYGLIAEEVDKVYPELVIRDETGKIQGVRYDELAPMLLNEMQQQRAQMTQRIDSQATRIASLEQQLAGIQAALVKLQPRDQFVAQR